MYHWSQVRDVIDTGVLMDRITHLEGCEVVAAGCVCHTCGHGEDACVDDAACGQGGQHALQRRIGIVVTDDDQSAIAGDTDASVTTVIHDSNRRNHYDRQRRHNTNELTT